MTDFPSNSKINKPEATPPKAPEKKIESVVTGTVIQKKPSRTKRFLQMFGGGDARSAGEFVLVDVLIPALRNAIADSVSQGVEKLVFGEVRSASRAPKSPSSWTPYGTFSRSGAVSNPAPVTLSHQARATHNFDDIILGDRLSAENVINSLYDLLNQYEVVSVKDLYALLDVTSAYTDGSWGWTDLRGSDIVRVTQGYLLKLPKPQPI